MYERTLLEKNDSTANQKDKAEKKIIVLAKKND